MVSEPVQESRVTKSGSHSGSNTSMLATTMLAALFSAKEQEVEEAHVTPAVPAETSWMPSGFSFTSLTLMVMEVV